MPDIRVPGHGSTLGASGARPGITVSRGHPWFSKCAIIGVSEPSAQGKVSPQGKLSVMSDERLALHKDFRIFLIH